MKVIYNLDLDNEDSNDKFDLKLIQNASLMYLALSNISEDLRTYRKGYISYDELENKINESLIDSNIAEIL